MGIFFNRKMREGEVHGYDRYSRKRERRYYDYDSPDRKYRKIDDRRHIRHRDDDDYSHRTSRRERYYDSRRYKDHISPRKQEKERNSLSPSQKNNNEKDNNPSIIEEEFVDKKEEIIVEKSKESIISKDDYLDLLSQELEEKNREEESLRLLAER